MAIGPCLGQTRSFSGRHKVASLRGVSGERLAPLFLWFRSGFGRCFLKQLLRFCFGFRLACSSSSCDSNGSHGLRPDRRKRSRRAAHTWALEVSRACSVLHRLNAAATVAAATEHYNRNQDHAGLKRLVLPYATVMRSKVFAGLHVESDASIRVNEREWFSANMPKGLHRQSRLVIYHAR